MVIFKMVNNISFNIAIMPEDRPDAATVRQVAGMINEDEYRTRLLMTGKLPKIIARYQSLQEADSVIKDLIATGLIAFVYEESIADININCMKAKSIEFKPSEIICHGPGHETKSLTTADVFLIIKSNRQIINQKETTTTKHKLSIKKTLITGGIPIFDKVKTTNFTESVSYEMCLRIYDRTSLQVELNQNNMDYKFLAQKRGLSSTINFNTTVSEIHNTFPDAIFDDKLSQYNLSTGSNFETSCRLLYLFYKALYNLP